MRTPSLLPPPLFSEVATALWESGFLVTISEVITSFSLTSAVLIILISNNVFQHSIDV